LLNATNAYLPIRAICTLQKIVQKTWYNEEHTETAKSVTYTN